MLSKSKKKQVQHITVDGVTIELIRKQMKTIRIGVYPPNGVVRVAVPDSLGVSAIHQAVLARLDWIKTQQRKFVHHFPQAFEMIDGEIHYFLGEMYTIKLNPYTNKKRIQRLQDQNVLEFQGPLATSVEQKKALLVAWYRQQLKELISPLIEKWQSCLGVQVNEWRIKQMKTKWGACNTVRKRIWLNLELAKKPIICIEYVVLHELAHLIEPSHNTRFKAILDQHQPQWRIYRQMLNGKTLTR
jgi:predicted metal-dependent hydrolase